MRARCAATTALLTPTPHAAFARLTHAPCSAPPCAQRCPRAAARHTLRRALPTLPHRARGAAAAALFSQRVVLHFSPQKRFRIVRLSGALGLGGSFLARMSRRSRVAQTRAAGAYTVRGRCGKAQEARGVVHDDARVATHHLRLRAAHP
jgi:hypothetical protein